MRTWAATVFLTLVLAACGGVTSDPPGSDGSGGSTASGGADAAGGSDGSGGSSDPTAPKDPVEPGGDCDTPDATAPAVDGCNTCSCRYGYWLCTAGGCLPECQEGETMPAGDGCNSCSCSDDGTWACTLVDCATECEPGTLKAAGDGCNTCFCSDDGTWGCSETACPEPACPIPDDASEPPCPGDTLYGRLARTDACCELCSSYEGYHYYDSLEACEASKVCTPGDTKYADDECNTCTCSADGTWACTDTFCSPVRCGGFSGGTCTEDEFCAYEADFGGCGAGDASAICRSRPTACEEEEAPVCACNGMTFSNKCLANIAGYGISYNGECQ